MGLEDEEGDSEDMLSDQQLLALCRGFLLTREQSLEHATMFARGFLVQLYGREGVAA